MAANALLKLVKSIAIGGYILKVLYPGIAIFKAKVVYIIRALCFKMSTTFSKCM